MIQVNCRSLTSADTEVQEIMTDDSNYYRDLGRVPTTPSLHSTLPTTPTDEAVTLEGATPPGRGNAGGEYQVEEILVRGNGTEMETGAENQSNDSTLSQTPTIITFFAV